MPSEHPDKNASPPPTPETRIVDAGGSFASKIGVFSVPATDEERRAQAREWEETVAALAAITDDSDTDEVWSAVLRNLGIAPDGGGV